MANKNQTAAEKKAAEKETKELAEKLTAPAVTVNEEVISEKEQATENAAQAIPDGHALVESLEDFEGEKLTAVVPISSLKLKEGEKDVYVSATLIGYTWKIKKK